MHLLQSPWGHLCLVGSTVSNNPQNTHTHTHTRSHTHTSTHKTYEVEWPLEKKEQKRTDEQKERNIMWTNIQEEKKSIEQKVVKLEVQNHKDTNRENRKTKQKNKATKYQANIKIAKENLRQSVEKDCQRQWNIL